MANIFKGLSHHPIRESPTIRFSSDIDTPLSDFGGLGTPASIFIKTIETHSEKRCLAFRKIIANVEDTKLLGDWTYYTYGEVGQRVKEMAAGLRKLLPGKRAQRLHMCAANSATWFLLSHAAAITSIELICVNTKIGQQELTHTVTNIPATAVFTETGLISRLLTPLVECPHVKLIIYDSTTEVEDDIEMVKNEVEALKKGLQNKVRIISIDELCLIGLEVLENFTPVIPTDRERIWGHMYPRSLNEFQLPVPDTLTNGNVAAGFAGMHHALKAGLAKDDTYLSYLPMYFRLEYNLINTLFMSGCTVAFGTDVEKFVLSAPYNERICPASYGDALSFCPTILWGIRPWWDVVHTQLAKAISMLPPEEKDDFWRYLEKKRTAVSSRIVPHPIVHMLERRGHIDRVRLGFFGDRIRWIGNTCSMMTVEMREFLGLVLGGPRGIMVEGWTLPGVNADITFMGPQFHSRTGLGRPLPSLELKLVAAPGEDVNPLRNIYRGLVYIRGPSLARSKALASDNSSATVASSKGDETLGHRLKTFGWVRTDRIGEWDRGKQSLRIIDVLVEPLTARYLGDYIPVETVEAVYRRLPYVLDCILVNSWKCLDLIGIICTEEDPLRSFAKENIGQVAATWTIEKILQHVDLKKQFVHHLKKHALKQGLVCFELVGGVVIACEPWDKRMRTAEGVIDREKIVAQYSTEIEEVAKYL